MGASASSSRLVVREKGRPAKIQGNGKGLTKLPKRLYRAKGIQEIWLQDNDIEELCPDGVKKWTSVELVYLCNNKRLRELPSGVGSWTKLQEANFSMTDIASLPVDAKCWTDLRQIYLNKLPKLTSLPSAAVGVWSSLKVLHVNECALEALPESVEHLRNLTMVALNGNKLRSLPKGIGMWEKVEKMFLNDCKELKTLPGDIGGMHALEKLYINNSGLTSLPKALGSLSSLLELYVTNNNITELPNSLAQCKSLGKLYVNQNSSLKRIPEGLADLKSLEILHASDCKLSGSVFPSFVKLQNLKFFHIKNNNVDSLPKDVLRLSQLRVFDVDGNPLSEDSKRVAEQVSKGLVKAWTFDRKKVE